jgi:hypothetical protein
MKNHMILIEREDEGIGPGAGGEINTINHINTVHTWTSK